MAQDRIPLFVRLPRRQVAALDRLADAAGCHKQHLVSEMLAERLAVGRVNVSAGTGSEALRDRDRDEVLTLEEVAELLRVPDMTVRFLAERGELPGRRLADEWRFARAAVLAWLAQGEKASSSVLELKAES